MRRAAKVDSNHRVIVQAFRALGCTVQSLAAVGKGVPDLLVGFAGLNHLVEVKVAKGKETPAQVKWAAMWRTTVHLVRSVEDVQRLVKAWADQHHRNTWGIRSVVASVVPSDVEVDASDYERPLKPGEWLPMPHKDSPTVKP